MTPCPRCSGSVIRQADTDGGSYDRCLSCGDHTNETPWMPRTWQRDTERLKLPEKQRRPAWTWGAIRSKAAVKFKAAGMPRKEIAGEMKVSVRTVGRYLREARI